MTTTATTQQKSYILTAREFDATRAKVAKMNARATKKGLTGRIDLVGEPITWNEDTPAGKVRRAGWEVTITGTPPVYGGWEFIARAEWLPTNGGLVVSSAPGVTEGSIDRDSLKQGRCDHCTTNRRRSKVYIVRHVDTGEQKQVGTACVTDFTGWQSTISWTSVKAVEDELALAGLVTQAHRDWGHPTDWVLAIADHLIATGGFIPTQAEIQSTRDQVELVVDPPLRMSPDFHLWRAEVCAAANALVDAGQPDKVRAYINGDEAGQSDYIANLRAVLAEPIVAVRHFGLAVSAPQAYRRHLAAQEPAKVKVESKHIGGDGEKMVDVPVTVGDYYWFDTLYGPKAYVTFTTIDGNVLKWCTTSDAFTEREGDVVNISFTVAEHNEYRGQKQTMVMRARVSKPART